MRRSRPISRNDLTPSRSEVARRRSRDLKAGSQRVFRCKDEGNVGLGADRREMRLLVVQDEQNHRRTPQDLRHLGRLRGENLELEGQLGPVQRHVVQVVTGFSLRFHDDLDGSRPKALVRDDPGQKLARQGDATISRLHDRQRRNKDETAATVAWRDRGGSWGLLNGGRNGCAISGGHDPCSKEPIALVRLAASTAIVGSAAASSLDPRRSKLRPKMTEKNPAPPG